MVLANASDLAHDLGVCVVMHPVSPQVSSRGGQPGEVAHAGPRHDIGRDPASPRHRASLLPQARLVKWPILRSTAGLIPRYRSSDPARRARCRLASLHPVDGPANNPTRVLVEDDTAGEGPFSSLALGDVAQPEGVGATAANWRLTISSVVAAVFPAQVPMPVRPFLLPSKSSSRLAVIRWGSRPGHGEALRIHHRSGRRTIFVSLDAGHIEWERTSLVPSSSTVTSSILARHYRGSDEPACARAAIRLKVDSRVDR
jgi:hypothetical protein